MLLSRISAYNALISFVSLRYDWRYSFAILPEVSADSLSTPASSLMALSRQYLLFLFALSFIVYLVEVGREQSVILLLLFLDGFKLCPCVEVKR